MQSSSPSTSISQLGPISEGTNSKTILNSKTNPCQTLVYHTCHLQHAAPSLWPKHSTKSTPAVFAICPCISAAASTALQAWSFMPQTTPGLTHPRAPADATPPHNKEQCKMKSRESQPLHAPGKSSPKNFSYLCWFPGTTATVEKDTNPLWPSLLR